MNDEHDRVSRSRAVIAHEGWLWLLLSLVVCVVAARLGYTAVAGAMVVVMVFQVLLFRDPPRVVPPLPAAVYAPVDGRVTAQAYRPGTFVNAALDKASDENERQLVGLETASGQRLGLVQIAGLVARRIVCRLEEGQNVRAGERYGLIRFGSRVDVFLPAGVAPLVVVGQRAIGGETVLADLGSQEPPRQGEVR